MFASSSRPAWVMLGVTYPYDWLWVPEGRWVCLTDNIHEACLTFSSHVVQVSVQARFMIQPRSVFFKLFQSTTLRLMAFLKMCDIVSSVFPWCCFSIALNTISEWELLYRCLCCKLIIDNYSVCVCSSVCVSVCAQLSMCVCMQLRVCVFVCVCVCV